MRFSCLPAALEMDILMAFRVKHKTDSDSSKVKFHLENTSKTFSGTSFQCNVDDHKSVQLEHSGPGRWANYFKVAFKVRDKGRQPSDRLQIHLIFPFFFSNIKGLLPHLPKSALESSNRPSQVDVLIDGTIPPESSLSSSAAMTTCSSIVILQAFHAREEISRKEMAEVAIESGELANYLCIQIGVF